MDISDRAKREIRSFAIKNTRTAFYSAAPIEVVDGWAPPTFTGRGFRYQTKTGKPVYPSAYRKAWGKPIYIHSTRRVVVGKKWLHQLETDILQLKLSEGRRIVSRALVEFISNFGDA
jgi:hypothetical protein